MIDLQRFCANKWEVRDYLQTPWRDGAWTYATNGHMIVRVPAAAFAAPDRSGKQPNNAPSLFQKFHTDADGEFLLMPPLPAAVRCPMCRGSGHVEIDSDPEECYECHGYGVELTPFPLGDAAFNVHYLRMFSALPQARIRTADHKTAAALIFDGGEALLMPCRL